jgi:hypothetical protein
MSKQENRELLTKIFGAFDDSPQPRQQGMKTTKVPGFPVFFCWGRWGGAESNEAGNNKGLLFLPYLQTGQMPLNRYNGSTSLETPLEMVTTGVDNPFNMKVSITPSLNLSGLKVGEYFIYLVALLPAAVGGGGKPTPYWDGWLKSYSVEIKDPTNKDYFGLLDMTRKQWEKIKAADDDFQALPYIHTSDNGDVATVQQ